MEEAAEISRSADGENVHDAGRETSRVPSRCRRQRSRGKSVHRRGDKRSHTGFALSFQREDRRADQTGRGRAVAESRSARADETDRIQEPRWPNDSWLSHPAGRTRGEESAGGGESARRPVGAR